MRQRSTAVRWLGFTAAAGERGFLLEVAFQLGENDGHLPGDELPELPGEQGQEPGGQEPSCLVR